MGPCLSSGGRTDDNALSINQRIERMNKRDKEKLGRILKLLLLGAGESGKSTLFKQISILNGKKPSQLDLEENAEVVRMNIINNIRLLIEYANENGMDMGSLSSDAISLLDRYGNISVINKETMGEYKEDSELTPQIVDTVKAIWSSDWGKAAWEKRADYQVLDALAYFMENIDRIAEDGYVPSMDDYLHSRIRSTGIATANFTLKSANFQIIDVGGQRNERKKWIHCFDNVTAIIFVAAISEYNQTLFEDTTFHRITEALNLFQEILDNPLFAKTPIILFLNKVDLFAEKLKQIPLQSIYPEFKGPYIEDEGVSSKKALLAAQEYMRDKFLLLNQHGSVDRTVYAYYTTATDSQNIDKVFTSTKDIILQKVMNKHFV